ncbi:MAG TPA: hypothetical protein VM223_21075 [Planctomycetota bacterium]|nr:hypothetical protein [Planctomycetota bacterium]
MAYCTSADVLRELPHITIDATTQPSADGVTQFCTDVAAEIDARLRAVSITVPVTDEDGLAVLKPLSINGVKAKILRAKELEDGEAEQAATYEELYQTALERIERRPSMLRTEDSPGQVEGIERDDEDIAFTRMGTEW